MKSRYNTGLRQILGILFSCLFSVGVYAETSIAILDFDLNDLTLIPRTPYEIQRTASLKTMLEGELKRADGERSLINKLTLTQAVRAFLYFHDFLTDGVIQMSETVGQKISVDLISTYQQINVFIDEVMLAMLDVYEKKR